MKCKVESVVLAVTLPLLLFVFGCTAIAERVATHMARRSLERDHVFHLIEGDLALFRHCLEQRGGSCTGGAESRLMGTAGSGPATPTRAELGEATRGALVSSPGGQAALPAVAVLDHPVLKDALSLHNHLRGHTTSPTESFSVESGENRSGEPQSTLDLDLSLSTAADFADQVHRATSAGAWDALAENTAVAVAASSPTRADHGRLAEDHRRAVFLREYLAAYFRNGRFIEVDFTVDAAAAQKRLADDLSAHAVGSCRAYNLVHGPAGGGASSSPDDCSGLAAQLYELLRGSGASVSRRLVKVSEAGFLSRDGSFEAQFPAFSIDLRPLQGGSLISLTADGKTIEEIDYTAIGNDLVRVVLEAVFDAHEGLPAIDQATGRLLSPSAEALPAIGSEMSPHLNAMVGFKQRLEAAVGAGLNRVIRGIGPLSLDNEALEELIVTLVVTSVGKAIDKATWCWFSCELDQQLEKAEAEIQAKIRAGEERVASKAKAVFDREAERVRLRVRLGS